MPAVTLSLYVPSVPLFAFAPNPCPEGAYAKISTFDREDVPSVTFPEIVRLAVESVRVTAVAPVTFFCSGFGGRKSCSMLLPFAPKNDCSMYGITPKSHVPVATFIVSFVSAYPFPELLSVSARVIFFSFHPNGPLDHS